MVSLTEEQITFIENDIRIRGITSPELSVDLLDHICCLMEERLDGYRNFETVYHETLLLFGEKGLKEIQDETNRLLIFKHYYLMNSTMKISGYVSSLLILLGSFFKFNHWPGANVCMLVGVFFLSVLFLPLLFILKFRSTAESNRSVTLSIIGLMASLMICIGVIFKIMHWPGAQITIIGGGILLLLGYLPIYFISVYKNTTNKLNATATVTLIIAGVGLLVTSTGISGLTRQTSDSFWRGVTENNDVFIFQQQQLNNSFATLLNAQKTDTTKNTEQIKLLKNTSEELLKHTRAMKNYLISVIQEVPESTADKMNLDELRTAGDRGMLEGILLMNPSSKPEFSAAELKQRLEQYKTTIHQLAPNLPQNLLNTDQLTVYGEQVPWEEANFDHLPLPLVIYNLIRIELAVSTVEQATFQQLSI